MTDVQRSTYRPAAQAAIPGDVLLEPVVLIALAVLFINDRWWKGVGPSWLTGKLSDIAGLFFLPLLALAGLELSRRVLKKADWRVSHLNFALLVLAVGGSFVLMKIWVPAADVYSTLVGALQWPIRAAASAIGRGPITGLGRAEVTLDASDVIALPALLGAYGVGRRRTRTT